MKQQRQQNISRYNLDQTTFIRKYLKPEFVKGGQVNLVTIKYRNIFIEQWTRYI